MRAFCLRTPGRGGVGQAAPVRGHPGPGPSVGCALCVGAKCRTENRQRVASVWEALRTVVPCGQSAAVRSCRCWVVPGLDTSSSAGFVRRVPSLHSSVGLRPAHPCTLFLQANGHLHLRAVLAAAAAILVQAPIRLPGVQGAAVRFRSRLSAQTLSVFRRQSRRPKLPKTAPGMRSSRFAPSAPLVTGRHAGLPATKSTRILPLKQQCPRKRDTPPEGSAPIILL